MQILRQEGIVGLYRGMALPLATVAAFNAVLFSTRGTINSTLAHADGAKLLMTHAGAQHALHWRYTSWKNVLLIGGKGVRCCSHVSQPLPTLV
jgi:redox-sensitive bicupin YhaK (pirin superfamily)